VSGEFGRRTLYKAYSRSGKSVIFIFLLILRFPRGLAYFSIFKYPLDHWISTSQRVDLEDYALICFHCLQKLVIGKGPGSSLCSSLGYLNELDHSKG